MSSQSSSSKTSPFAKWTLPLYRGDVLPFLRDQMQQYAGQGGVTPLRAAGDAQMLATARGDYLRPESNPYLASTADAIRRAAGENLDRSLNRIGQNAELGGSLFSTKTNQQKFDAARASNQDVTDRLTNLYGGNYGAERTNQVNAAGTAGNADQQRLLAFLELLKGSEGKTSSSGWGLL